MYTFDYKKYFNLYLAAANTTIAMVLVQENDEIEHLIYYLSHNINDIENNFSYITTQKILQVGYLWLKQYRYFDTIYFFVKLPLCQIPTL